MKQLYDLAYEFNKRFTSGNSVPVDSSIKVPTKEWEELYKMICHKAGQETMDNNEFVRMPSYDFQRMMAIAEEINIDHTGGALCQNETKGN